MTSNTPSFPSEALPSRNRLQFVMLAPVAVLVLATALLHIRPITAVATFLGALGVILLGRRGYMTLLHPVPNRSWLRAQFQIMYEGDEWPPRLLQRWYARLAGAALAASLAEFLQTVFILYRAGVALRVDLVVGPVIVGLLEGVFLILLAKLCWALASLVLLRPPRRRAA